MTDQREKTFLVHVTETRHFEFTVTAANKDDAFDKGVKDWSAAPEVGGWELPDQETDYIVTECAEGASADRAS